MTQQNEKFDKNMQNGDTKQALKDVSENFRKMSIERTNYFFFDK